MEKSYLSLHVKPTCSECLVIDFERMPGWPKPSPLFRMCSRVAIPVWLMVKIDT